MKLYTIYLGKKLWENIIDDMNSTDIWAEGGMLWTSREKAEACIADLKQYDFETPRRKFHVVTLTTP